MLVNENENLDNKMTLTNQDEQIGIDKPNNEFNSNNITNNDESEQLKNRIKLKFGEQEDGINFIDDILPKNNYYRKNNILPPRTVNNKEPKFYDDYKQIVPFKSRDEYKINFPENPVLDKKKVRINLHLVDVIWS